MNKTKSLCEETASTSSISYRPGYTLKASFEIKLEPYQNSATLSKCNKL